jgi:hypothetical protein
MRYPTLTSSDAKKIVESRRAGTPIEPESLEVQRGHGTPLELTFVEKLKKELAKRQRSFGTQLKERGDREGAAFEALAAERVHGLVPKVPEAIADAGFWRWMAVAHFAPLIEWRYGSKSSGCALNNYGIGSSSENFLFRLWLRGELGHDIAASDPYLFARRGDVDFWRSHVFRQSYANARQFGRALLKYQYPDPKGPARLKTSAIRELVKRLRRVRMNRCFELMDEAACLRCIEDEAGKLAS